MKSDNETVDKDSEIRAKDTETGRTELLRLVYTLPPRGGSCGKTRREQSASCEFLCLLCLGSDG